MSIRSRIAAAVVTGVAAGAALSGTALAQFPEFSDCPWTDEVPQCLDVQTSAGTLKIGGHAIPLGDSLEIRGAIDRRTPFAAVVPPVGTTGLFADPVTVPGGLVGRDLRAGQRLNTLTVTIEAAGPNPIGLNRGTLDLRVNVKLTLRNALIGPGCQIGSDSDPITLRLTGNTTSPPLPALPISGRVGELQYSDDGLLFYDNTHVDNAFAVPAASGCSLRALNRLLDWRFDLPSPAGTNEISVDDDLFISY